MDGRRPRVLMQKGLDGRCSKSFGFRVSAQGFSGPGVQGLGLTCWFNAHVGAYIPSPPPRIVRKLGLGFVAEGPHPKPLIT